jgi:hypothetical protein
MKRFLLVLVTVVGVVGAAACNKPSEEDCKQAITNMQKLLGTQTSAKEADNNAEVRRCRGGSSRESVTCAVKATTLDDLKACGFMGKAN